MHQLRKISFVILCLCSLNGLANDIPLQLVNTEPQMSSNPQKINSSEPQKVDHIFQRVIVNENWKTILSTSSELEVISMSISRQTNKKNELGLQKHASEIIIFIIEGKAIADINNNQQIVQPGDMILIPKDTIYNLINLDKISSLKILVIFTKTNIDNNTSAYNTPS